MKKLELLFVTIAMLMLFAVSASAETYYTEGDYAYKVENGEATITDVDTSISGDVTIPSTLGGYSVTSIGDYAFESCDSLTSITIPDSVTSIGDYAFRYCSKLANITIPEGVTSIGWVAFGGTGLKSVTIPSSVTSIGETAFAACTNLISITVDESNKNYSNDSNGVLFNKDKTELIAYPAGNTNTTYIIPDSVTSIDSGAFYGCVSLTNITIPDSVISMYKGAFYNCTGLTSIEIPGSVTSIDTITFYECTSLTSVTILEGVTSIGDGAFYGCTALTDVYYTGSQSQWNEIDIDLENDDLLNATIHYDYNPHTHSYTAKITKEPTHLEEGVQTFTCACDDSYTESIAKTTEHTYNVSDIVAPKCEDKGYTVYVCECGYTYKDNYTSATGHKYDGQTCVDCGKKCSCNCHKTGIANFFWKIANFFNKLFKIKNKQMCACGIAHY